MLFLHYAVFLRKQKTHKQRTKCICNYIGTPIVKTLAQLILKGIVIGPVLLMIPPYFIQDIGIHLAIYQISLEIMKKQFMEEALIKNNIVSIIQDKMWPLSIFILLLLQMTSLTK